MLGDDNWAVVDWADAPEVHDKVIFQNVDTCFHVLLAGGGDNFAGLYKKSIYFVDRSAALNLCKWDFLQ